MIHKRTPRLLALMLSLAYCTLPAQSEEMVTIPKSRLEELERKEAELAKLKGEVTVTKEQNIKPEEQHEADAARIANTPAPVPQPVVTHEELERKEAELAKLKGEVTKTREENLKLEKQ